MSTHWKPFEVVISLASPVSLNHPWIHFDGIISHLIHQRILGRDYYLLPTKALQTLAGNEMGKWRRTLGLWRGQMNMASVGFFPHEKLGTLQYFKRFEAEGFPGRRADLGSGHYRSWMLRTVYVASPEIWFYGRGEIGMVEDLLEDLTHVGNDTRMGWGQIANLYVRRSNDDLSLVCNGFAQRPIPVRLLSSYDDSAPLAWRPPYWSAQNVEECAPPGARVELR